MITRIERRIGQRETVTVCWYGWVKFALAVGVATGLIIGFAIGVLVS